MATRLEVVYVCNPSGAFGGYRFCRESRTTLEKNVIVAIPHFEHNLSIVPETEMQTKEPSVLHDRPTSEIPKAALSLTNMAPESTRNLVKPRERARDAWEKLPQFISPQRLGLGLEMKT